MTYSYEDYKNVFGTSQAVKTLREVAGNIRAECATSSTFIRSRVTICDSWMRLACIDKLTELGCIELVSKSNLEYRNIKL